MDLPTDIMHEIIKHLDLKSSILLYASTSKLNKLCDNVYWKILYNKCYASKYYRSTKYKLTEYKYQTTLNDTLILKRKYTDKEYVIIYYTLNKLASKIGDKLEVNHRLVLKSIDRFYPEITSLFTYTWLTVSHSQLYVIPPSIGSMTNLKELSLSLTNISELPKEIGSLVKLKTLYVDENNLISLPKEIGLLTNLVYLDCSSNKLTSLPNEISSLIKLKRFYLHNNQLRSLPNMTSLNKLKEISLNFNHLSFNDVSTITSPKLWDHVRNMLNSS
jgi:hypothetical protein